MGYNTESRKMSDKKAKKANNSKREQSANKEQGIDFNSQERKMLQVMVDSSAVYVEGLAQIRKSPKIRNDLDTLNSIQQKLSHS